MAPPTTKHNNEPGLPGQKEPKTATPIFIYALVSTRDGRQLPWYIGQALIPDLRLRVDHRRDSTSSAKAIWIQQEHAAGFKVEIRVVEECRDKATADERESYWIEAFRAINPALKNIGRGNRRSTNPRWQAQLQKAAERHRARLAVDREWLEKIVTPYLSTYRNER